MATRRDKRNEGNLRRNRHADSRRNASAFSAGVLTRRRTRIPSSQRSAHCCLWRTNPFSRASPVADVDAATMASLDGRLWSAYCCFRRVYLSSRVSAVLRKRHRCCLSVLRCSLRCAQLGNETTSLRPSVIVRGVGVNGGVSLETREKAFSLVCKTESGCNELTNKAKEHGGNRAVASRNQSSANRYRPNQKTAACTGAINAEAFKNCHAPF